LVYDFPITNKILVHAKGKTAGGPVRREKPVVIIANDYSDLQSLEEINSR
jgi:hypothetical protein